jgi:hypothetical protein
MGPLSTEGSQCPSPVEVTWWRGPYFDQSQLTLAVSGPDFNKWSSNKRRGEAKSPPAVRGPTLKQVVLSNWAIFYEKSFPDSKELLEPLVQNFGTAKWSSHVVAGGGLTQTPVFFIIRVYQPLAYSITHEEVNSPRTYMQGSGTSSSSSCSPIHDEHSEPTRP